jgi:hypothetical protein
VGAVLPTNILPIDQSEIGLVYEGSGLQSVTIILVLDVLVSKPAQFLVDEWRQLLNRRAIPLAPADK